jgi:hypothetical protein
MAMAWPRLRELSLGTERALGGVSNVTLTGLLPLVEYCPDLEILRIIVNATKIPALPQTGSPTMK